MYTLFSVTAIQFLSRINRKPSLRAKISISTRLPLLINFSIHTKRVTNHQHGIDGRKRWSHAPTGRRKRK
jgi:hypothetical protein